MAIERVCLAVMAPTLNLCNYFFSIDQGFFRQEGLDIEVIVRPGLRNTEAVLKGEALFGAANECVIQTALRGATPLRIVLQVLNDPLHDLIVPSRVRDIGDLKGERIGVPGAGSTPEIQTRLLFRKSGLVPDKDVVIVPQSHGETMEDRIRKFEQGEYGALIASPPNPFLLHAKGYKTLTELSSHFPHSASHGMVATSDTIAKRHGLVEAMVRGYRRGVTVLKQDRDAALDFICARFKLDRDLAGRCYDLLKERWTADLSVDALRTEIEFHARNASLPAIAPDAIADRSFHAAR